MSIFFHVFFEDPFWVGLFSISDGSTVKYCRIVFGQEPSDIELYTFILNNFNSLKLSEIDQLLPENNKLAANPKKRKKQASEEIKARPGSKLSYKIIKQSLAAGKKESKRNMRHKIENGDKKLSFEIKQRKRKEKHKGH